MDASFDAVQAYQQAQVVNRDLGLPAKVEGERVAFEKARREALRVEAYRALTLASIAAEGARQHATVTATLLSLANALHLSAATVLGVFYPGVDAPGAPMADLAELESLASKARATLGDHDAAMGTLREVEAREGAAQAAAVSAASTARAPPPPSPMPLFYQQQQQQQQQQRQP